MTSKIKLTVSSYAQLRDTIHSSGLFDLTDCNLAIACPLQAPVQEVEQIVNLVESLINVVKVDIAIDPTIDDYEVTLLEVSVDTATERTSRKSRFDK